MTMNDPLPWSEQPKPHLTYIEPETPALDENGLRRIETMSDRELLVEIALSMRTVGAALAAMQKMGPAGMMKAALTGKLDLKPPTQ